MRILGITDGQTSGAALIEDGRLIAAVNEERIARLKLARGFPGQSIQEVLRLGGWRPAEIDAVAVAQIDMEFREQIADWPGWFEARHTDINLHSRFFRAASRFGGIAPHMPGLARAYYSLRVPVYRRRRARIAAILQQQYGIHAPIQFVHHHYAHAASAYYTSNFDDALVVSMDGGGDKHSSHVYSVRGGVFERVNATGSYDSLGNYYAYVTALCGFKAKRHEGKITGLAAHGTPVYRGLLESMIGFENGRPVNRARVLFDTAMSELRRRLPTHWEPADLAASIQQVAESIACDYVRYWCKKTGHRNVALAGGLFANVRINEEIHRLPEVRQTFVHPGMSDEGLAVGAAFAVAGERARHEGRRHEPHSLSTVYLGTGYSEQEIADALQTTGLEIEYHSTGLEGEVARRLAEGHVVARFDGRMEYGPRALGNRTILYQAGDPSVNDWLNELLKRTEFMPFAPAVLWEHTDSFFEGTIGARDTARFMTITFHCRPRMTDRCRGVVHVDNTARPQLVRREDNPSYYRVLEEYERRTGVPVLINTSFNVHEEPIVRSPGDALRAFLDSSLDYLAIGPFLVKGPHSSAPARRKWEGRSSWGRTRQPVGVLG